MLTFGYTKSSLFASSKVTSIFYSKSKTNSEYVKFYSFEAAEAEDFLLAPSSEKVDVPSLSLTASNLKVNIS